MTRLRHYDHLGTARFITFATHQWRPILKDEFASIVVRHVQQLRSRTGTKVFGFVIMPDHVHLVLLPPDTLRLGPAIGQMKALASRDILRAWREEIYGPISTVIRDGRVRRVVWQRRCHDHNCRNRDTLVEQIRYCHHNPVKAGLVSDPSDWKYSSFGWYQGRRAVPLAIDPTP